jgi:hypothetical protein
MSGLEGTAGKWYGLLHGFCGLPVWHLLPLWVTVLQSFLRVQIPSLFLTHGVRVGRSHPQLQGYLMT